MLGLAIALAAGSAAHATTWTWTGNGADDKWSNTANWTPANFPTNNTIATNNLIFDGFTRLTPDQDLADPYYVVTSMVFSANSGAFVLGGLTNVLGVNAWRSYQLSGSRPSVTVLGTSNILIKGAINCRAANDTNFFTIPSNVVLQVPSISSPVAGRTVAKNGPGLLRVYEDADGQYYTQAKSNVGPQWQINDGTVEMGTRTNCYIYNDTKGTNFILTTQVKGSYVVTVGDGIGLPTSAVMRVIGQLGGICGNPVWTILSDGLLDFNNIGSTDIGSTQPMLTISNGVLTRVGAGGLLEKSGALIDLRGSARIEGTAVNSISFYDACTNLVDATGTRAVIASDAKMASSGTVPIGAVFNVSNKPADVVALEITGFL